MKPDENALHFFLGSNTPQGFVSRFDQLADADDGWRCFVIKGGPGTGKSTMLKRIAAHLTQKGHPVEYIHCTSDVNSLDGVICPSLKLSFADGTPPHGK
ncbi:AAA family ATPase [Ruminococcaceae bacterium OttesenSCG-928-L11]|nr:AAA family ATPase [Ruminococcaceae bacterium OttesenSCG-928-L11]